MNLKSQSLYDTPISNIDDVTPPYSRVNIFALNSTETKNGAKTTLIHDLRGIHSMNISYIKQTELTNKAQVKAIQTYLNDQIKQILFIIQVISIETEMLHVLE